MAMRRLCLLLSILLSHLGAAAASDVVVIANPKVGAERLTRDDVVNIFLGRLRQFPSGQAALPADLPPAAPEKAQFYRQLVNKELAEINAYWARLVFSGRTQPPRQAHSAEELLSFVATTPGAVGYVERSLADGRVRIVFELPR